MFRWDRQRKTLNVPAGRVLQLERSLADFTVALPGLSPQPARAFLCAYQEQRGIRVAVVLQLLDSRSHAFYLNQEGELGPEEAARAFDQGRQFAESLGFMLGVMDYRDLPAEKRQRVWQQLTFLHAQPAAGQSAGTRPGAARQPPVKAADAAAKAPPRPPSPEEMALRRRRFIENLGRLLAML